MTRARLAFPSPWFAFALLALGSCGIAAVWIVLSSLSDRPCAWMAAIAALDAAWLLRLAGVAPGWRRMGAGVVATALAIAIAQWGIVAAQIGGMLGLGFAEAALRLGPSLAWTLITLANGAVELLWMGAAMVLAALASR
jgi:hypothetical protein